MGVRAPHGARTPNPTFFVVLFVSFVSIVVPLRWIGCSSATRGHPILVKGSRTPDCMMFFPSSFKVKSVIANSQREKNRYLTFDFDAVGRLEKSATNLETPLKGLFGTGDTYA